MRYSTQQSALDFLNKPKLAELLTCISDRDVITNNSYNFKKFLDCVPEVRHKTQFPVSCHPSLAPIFINAAYH